MIDKYEYKLKSEQMKALTAEGDYEAAAEIADTIQWRKVRNINLMIKAADIYSNSKLKRFEDAKEILQMAYDRSPIGRMIVYRLAELAIKTRDFDEAKAYYEEFVQNAPHDNLKYVLRYKISKAKGADIQTRIAILEELKEAEYTEEWTFELAYLYHKAGEYEKCIDTCDELILWFGDGIYVERALELKLLHKPLTKTQEDKYQAYKQRRDGVKEVYPQEEAVRIPEVKELVGELDTAGLQEEIKRNIGQILHTESRPPLAEDSVRPQMASKEAHGTGYRPDHWERTSQEMEAALEGVAQKEQELKKAQTVHPPEDIMDLLADVIPKMDNGIPPEQHAQEEGPPGGGQTIEKLGRMHTDIRTRGLPLEPPGSKEAESDLLRKIKRAKPRFREQLGGRTYIPRRIRQPGLSDGPVGDMGGSGTYVSQPDAYGMRLEVGALDVGTSDPYTVQSGIGMSDAYGTQSGESVPDAYGAHPEAETSDFYGAQSDAGMPDSDGIDPDAGMPDSDGIDPDAGMQDSYGVQLGAKKPDRGEPDTYGTQPEEGSPDSYGVQPETEESDIRMESEEARTADFYARTLELEAPEVGELDSYGIQQPEGMTGSYGISPDAGISDAYGQFEETQETGDMQAGQDEMSEITGSGECEEYDGPIASEEMQAAEAEFYGPLAEVFPEEPFNGQPGNLVDQMLARQDTKEIKAKQISEALDRHLQEMSEQEEEVLTDIEELAGEAELPEITELDDGLKAIFSYFVPVAGMEKQICEILTGMVAKFTGPTVSPGGNILIQGGRGCGKTILATRLIKALKKITQRQDIMIGKIDGDKLNQKDLTEIFQKIPGGCLIIERAGDIARETAIKLSLLLDNDETGILILMEDTRLGLEDVLKQDEAFSRKFTQRIIIPVFTSDELVEFGKTYANERKYEIETMGVLALYNRISNIQKLDQPTTLIEIKDIIDEAIENAERKSWKRAFSIFTSRKQNENDYGILREKDFEE